MTRNFHKARTAKSRSKQWKLLFNHNPFNGCDVVQKFEQFGKYILLEKLATGGMAEVFLARSQAAGGITKFVAVKRILPQYADSPEFIDMFKDEAKIAVNLNHSNIVSIYDFGVQHKQFYLVMDYVEGRNLRQILNKLKKGNLRLSVDQVIYIIREVATGLEHAHRCLDGSTGKPLNITHRDMSPQNVMVSFEGEVKIVDFGIAKAESQLETTRAGTLKGKFGYMSPEQAEGHTVDLRTDIFSLGIVLWELLANDRLFIASNELNTLRKIRDCQVPSLRKINPNIPTELERITMKALARDRNLRYQTSAAMHRDLNRFLNRQYPEFSAQDFATFIKNQFSEDIFLTRQRLVEYAKIPGTEGQEGERLIRQTSSQLSTSKILKDGKTEDAVTNSYVKSDLSEEATGTQSSAGKSLQDSFSDKSAYSLRPEGMPQTSDAATRASIPAPQTAAPAPEHNQLDEKALRREQNRPKPSNYGVETEDGSQPAIDSRSRSFSRTGVQKRRKKNISSQTFMGMVCTLFALSCYIYLAKYQRTLVLPMVVALDPYLKPLHTFAGISGQNDLGSVGGNPSIPLPPIPDPEDPPVFALPIDPQPEPTPPLKPPKDPVYEVETDPEPLRPDEPRGSVLITSTPSGAEIFVNGKASGDFTPSRVEVPSSREFAITLRRAGFIDYRRSGLNKAQVGSKLSATLQSALVGYLDIDVTPPQNVKIYINGTLLKGEQLPIQKYAVPAETPITVRAVDPVSQTSDQKVLTVEKDKRRRVVLDLRKGTSKNDRQPSRKP